MLLVRLRWAVTMMTLDGTGTVAELRELNAGTYATKEGWVYEKGFVR
jgi:hypothetical protein